MKDMADYVKLPELEEYRSGSRITLICTGRTAFFRSP